MKDGTAPASGTPGRDFLLGIRYQNAKFSQLFTERIESYNGEGELDVLEVFGEAMLALDEVVDCRWGCDQDHAEKHLVARAVSNIRATFCLMASGYTGEASSYLRPLGEAANLMEFLAAFPSELEAFRASSRKQRKRLFRAKRVRGLLKQEGLRVALNGRAYGNLSDLYLHPNALNHVFGYRTSRESLDIPYFQRDICLSLALALFGMSITTLVFWARAQGDDREAATAHALNSKMDEAVRAFVRKLKQDQTVDEGLVEALAGRA